MRAIKDHEAYLLLGGRLNLLENSSDTIKREIEEELGLILEYKLISIEENIVESTKFQMLEFVYYAEIDSFDLINSLDDGWDKFKIFDIYEIDKVDIRPKTITNLVKQEEYKNITHHINYDWV